MAIAWMSALLAFVSFAAIFVEYSVHGRSTFLFFSAAFLSLGIMGVANSLTLAHPGVHDKFLAFWNLEWITLALVIAYGMVTSRTSGSKRPVGLAFAVLSFSILWAAVAIFLISSVPTISRFLAARTTSIVVTGVCATLFALGFVVFSRISVHRYNNVVHWMAYGLIFAVLSEVAAVLIPGTLHRPISDLASFMKVLVYLSPLAGMLAEHVKLQMRLQENSSDLTNLMQAQQAVASIKESAVLYERIIDLIVSSFSAASACILPFNEDRGLLEVTASAGFDIDTTKQLTFRPGEGPAGEAFSSKEIVFVKDVWKDPVLSRKLDGITGIGSAAFVPLMVTTDCLGILAIFFSGHPQNQKSLKEQTRLLEAYASQAALAVGGSKIRGWMLDSAGVSDEYAQEMDLVWEIGKAVAAKLELQDLVNTLSEKLRIAVGAKNCSVLVFDPDEVGLKILDNKNLVRYKSVAEHFDECDRVATLVAKRREPLVANNIPNTSHCKFRQMALDDGGVHHLLAVPMSLRGFLGTISVLRQNSEPFGDREKRLLMRLSSLVAAAIRNAELYEREKKIAETLQKSFLPDLEPTLPGYQISSRYEAAFDESRLGGDFYDIVSLGNDKYGIVIGDVSGKGLDAAVYTAMARYMIQAYSSDQEDPAKVIAKLNNALYLYTPAHRFITLVYGILDTKARTFTYVNAGHEYPFINRSGAGQSEYLQTTGQAVGAIADADYHSETISIEPGDVMVLYTDGASEIRSDGDFLGTEGLRDIVDAHIKNNVEDLPGAILESIHAYTEGHMRDDVALLVIKAKSPGSLF